MTLVQTLRSVRTDLRVAKAQIRASIAPMPDAAERRLLGFAKERLESAATNAGASRSRGPIKVVGQNAADAAALLGDAPSLGDKLSATSSIKTAQRILGQIPELRADDAARKAAWRRAANPGAV